ncbi:sortase [Streptomyces sp. HC44]|uniref:Sortase n=1 Tax=Streptomyces scabichelini TaxID=2711217 RepID=A0A6G4V849_9ACTN|nr:class E sortase [Streptomyces scabichelini]NGO10272.1 sortase [Streptomyces scabichelini]
MHRFRVLPAALACTVMAALLGCSTGDGATEESTATSGARVTDTADDRSGRASTGSPSTTKAPEPVPDTTSAQPTPRETDTRTRIAWLTIPAIDVESLRVVPYEGTTDDWPGTRIQNRGVAASPYGNRGGVGPGEVGNYLVTAHRLSAGGPLRELPALDEGDTVRVTSGGTVYEYEITDSRWTSFRSPRSLAEQRAAVPGFPGRRPTQAMITLSTCATPEDNAAGNYWRDAKGNPEHRIDMIGVLTSTRQPSSTP